jgi:uroporphyrinogen-III synthase
MLRRGDIDIVTFTSSSTVHNLLELLVELGEGDSKADAAVKASAATEDMVTITGVEDVEQIRADHIVFLDEGDDVPPEFDAWLERNLKEGTRRKKKVIKKLLTRPVIACIGPITAETARDVGLRVDVVASEHTVEGLVEALKQSLVGEA